MPEEVSSAPPEEVAELMYRMPRILRAAADFIDLDENPDDNAMEELLGKVPPDADLVIACLFTIGELAAQNDLAAGDLRSWADSIEAKVQP